MENLNSTELQSRMAILAYDTERKRLLVASERDPETAIEIELDCGDHPLTGGIVVSLQYLIDSCASGRAQFVQNRMHGYVPSTYEVFDAHEPVWCKNSLYMQPASGHPKVVVEDSIYKFQSSILSKKENYSLDGIAAFVEEINKEYVGNDMTLTLRVKGKSYISLDFDGIRILKYGEAIDKVGYAELRKRIESVAGKI